MSNIIFKITDTNHSFTSNGPITQDLSHQDSSVFNFNLNFTGITFFDPGSIEQASLSGIVLNISSGSQTQELALDMPTGIASGFTAKSLQQLLDIPRVGDTSILTFYNVGSALTGIGGVELTSNDPNVLGVPLTLFSGASSSENNGVSLVAIKTTNVTTGSETVNLSKFNFGSTTSSTGTFSGVSSAVAAPGSTVSLLQGGPTGNITIEGLVSGTGISLTSDINGNAVITENITGTSGIITYPGSSNNIVIDNLRDLSNYVVSPTAGDSEYTTIQSAYAAASSAGGGTILVKDGTYHLTGFSFTDPNVYLYAVGGCDNDRVILAGTGIIMSGLGNSEPVRIVGFQIGDLVEGFNMTVTGSSVLFDCCHLVNGGALVDPIVFCGNGSNIIFRNCDAVFTNDSPTAVALYATPVGTLSTDTSTVIVDHCDILISSIARDMLVSVAESLHTGIFLYSRIVWNPSNTIPPGSNYSCISMHTLASFTMMFCYLTSTLGNVTNLYMIDMSNSTGAGTFSIASSNFIGRFSNFYISNVNVSVINCSLSVSNRNMLIQDTISGAATTSFSNCTISANVGPNILVNNNSATFTRQVNLLQGSIRALNGLAANIDTTGSTAGSTINLLVQEELFNTNSAGTPWAILSGVAIGTITYGNISREVAATASGAWSFTASPITP